ncbi:acrylate utilization transcriptional regulator AcuR [Variovorax sp. RA8]|uniref:acrylate utilization transcriptional regulator AcuR n=1 Tax=Variovorax sp. (strain JCM 16519 / RA8) TaxID=662548 RepID=UPI000AB9EEDD|nr:TetR/AcrR family transcriptional regulator [Variovorax sp. RA8]VTU38668.1 Transcriptional regulator AcuR [Variovorax sp. RA8]
MSSITVLPRRRGRPAKDAGDYRATREALLNAGVAALTEKGFSATGIDEILKSVGVPKGSFYHFFANKEAFGAELIARYDEYFVRKLDRFLLDETKSPLDRIDAFFADAERGMKRFGFRRGCLVGNLGQEMGTLPEAFRSQLTNVLLDWQRRTAVVLEQARRDGEIGKATDCAEWAAFLWTGWEGAVLRAKLERKAAPLQMFARLFRQSIGA